MSNELVALIVDDSESVRELLSRELRQIAGKIFHASSLAAALEIVEREPQLHIATVDRAMPGSTPEEVMSSIRIIRARHPQCAILIMSGHCISGHKEEAIAALADGSVDKNAVDSRQCFLLPLLSAMIAHAAGNPERLAQLSDLMDAQFPQRPNGLPCERSNGCQLFQSPITA